MSGNKYIRGVAQINFPPELRNDLRPLVSPPFVWLLLIRSVNTAVILCDILVWAVHFGLILLSGSRHNHVESRQLLRDEGFD